MATEETPSKRRAPRATGPSDGEVSSRTPTSTTSITPLAPNREVAQPGEQGYVMPVVHIHLSERVVNLGFWGALVGSAALGVVDLPLAAMIGGAVYVARHHARMGIRT